VTSPGGGEEQFLIGVGVDLSGLADLDTVNPVVQRVVTQVQETLRQLASTDPFAGFRETGKVEQSFSGVLARVNELKLGLEQLAASSNQLQKFGGQFAIDPAALENLKAMRLEAEKIQALSKEAISSPGGRVVASAAQNNPGFNEASARQLLSGLGYSVSEQRSGVQEVFAQPTGSSRLEQQLNALKAGQQSTTPVAGGDATAQDAQAARLRELTQGTSAQALANLRLEQANAALERSGGSLDAEQIKELRTYEQLLSAVQAQIRAKEQLAKANEAAVGGGGGGGFFAGLGAGITGGGSGGDSSFDIGKQLGDVSRYIIYYQAFREIQTAIKDAIDQTVQFEREVTNLQTYLGGSRDAARDLATNLGDVAVAGGASPTQGVAFGTQFARTFQGQADPNTLLTQGAQTGTLLQTLTGADGSKGLEDATAAVNAFGLSYSSTQRIIDAATTAAQKNGFANASAILPGLGQIGDLAKISGFTPEQTSQALGDIQRRTGETSDAAAGELRRFFGREGNSAFQQVFSREGINTALPFNQELSQLAPKFPTLSTSEQNTIIGQFGGGRAGAAAVALLQDYNNGIKQAGENTTTAGVAQQQYAQRLEDIAGVLSKIRAEAQNLAKDLGESGLGAGFGILLHAAEPVLKTLDDVFQLVNSATGGNGAVRTIRDLTVGVVELGAAIALIQKFNVGGAVADKVGGLLGKTGSALDGRPAAAGVSAEAGAATNEALAASAKASAVALDELALSTKAMTVETDALTVSKTAEQLITDAEVISKTADVAATDAEVISKIADRLATIAGAGAKLASGVGSFVTAPLSPLTAGIAGAVGTGVIVDQLYSATKAQRSATAAGDALDIAPGDSAAGLQDQATKLRQAATASRQSSGGFFGSIENGVTNAYNSINGFFGQSNLASTTGASAGRDERLATISDAEAKRINDATAAAAASQTGAAASINLSGQAGITDSLKNLKNQGLDSGQQIDALIAKLNNFATAAAGAGNILAAGQSQIVAAQIGAVATNSLLSGAQIDLQAKAAGANGISGAQAGGAAQFLKLGAQGGIDLGQVVTDASNQFFGSQGLDAGGAISPDQQAQLTQQATDAAIKQFASSKGVSKGDVAGFSPEIQQAVKNAVSTSIAAANAFAGQTLNPGQVGQVVTALPTLLSGVETEATSAASLSGQDGSLVGIQAALAKGRAALSAIQGSSGSSQDVAQVTDLLNQLQLKEQAAVIARIDALGKLAESTISPFDASGRIGAQISTAQQALSQATDEVTRAQLQSQINDLQFQQAAQAVSDANAARDATVGPGQAVGKATAAYQDAVTKLNAIVGQGITSGQAYSDAVKAVNDASQSALDAQVAQVNAIAGSQVDPRNAVAVAAQKLQAAATVLANTPKFDSNGNLTTAFAAAQANVNQLSVASVDAQVAQINAQNDAGARAGDPVSQASAKLQDAALTLANASTGTTAFYVAQKAYKDAQLAYVAAVQAQQKDAFLLAGDATNPVTQAQAALQQARSKLATDQANGTGNLAADQVAVNAASAAAQKSSLDQQLADQKTQYDLRRESGSQYLTYLQGQDATLKAQLGTLKSTDQGYRQTLDEYNAVNAAILALNNQLQGQFNLGAIKVPSVYEVRRAVAAGNNSSSQSSVQYVNFNINGADTRQVKLVIEQTLGVQATGRTGVSTRKVAA
jgi:hypothetical protein